MAQAAPTLDPVAAATRGVLVVFTDALGSTQRDEESLKVPPNDDCPYLGAELRQSLDAMRAFRETLFEVQLTGLGEAEIGSKWQILKNVGDALVLASYPTPDCELSQFVAKSVRAVLAAWTRCTREGVAAIRIAMHFCPPGHTFSGGQLTGLAAALAQMTHFAQDSRDAFLRSLKFDLFGPGMNRVARLASAATGPLFVISEQAYLTMKGQDRLNADEVRRLYEAGFEPEDGFSLRGPIPLVRAKGVETVALPSIRQGIGPREQRPWWVWEVRASDGQAHLLSFGAESKRVQSLRVIHGLYRYPMSFVEAVDQTSELEGAIHAILHQDEYISYSFFCDLWLKIHEVWSYYTPRDDRDFRGPKAAWRNGTERLKSDFIPRYVVITSCPDDPTDSHIREKLNFQFPHSGTIKCAQAISYHVQGRTRVRQDERLLLPELTVHGKRVYVLLFQVKSDSLENADEPEEFLSDCFADKQITASSRFSVIAGALVRGDKDGFILLTPSGPTSRQEEDALRAWIAEAERQGGGHFLRRIAPVRMLVCESIGGFRRSNLEWLGELASPA